MKKKLFLLLFTILCISSFALPTTIDSTLIRDKHDSIRISMVTCSPGTEVYAVYGHTAIRIEVPSLGIDLAVNYGLFHFEAPHFMWRFLRGETDYIGATTNYLIFEREYLERGSSVTIQQLNLSEKEKVSLIALLEENLRPENRTYRYNFLYNNCSTRARDKVEEALHGQLEIKNDTTSTYRSIIHQYTAEYPWMQYGIDYLLGVEADLPINARKQMFAPEYLQHYLTETSLIDSGRVYPYIVKEEFIEATHEQPVTLKFPLSPIQCMILVFLLVAVICTLEFLIERRQGWFDILLLSIQGLMGCVITFLFFFSEHPAVDSNLHILYLNPLPLLFLPFIVRSLLHRKVSPLNYVLALMLIMFIIIALIKGQYIQPAAWILIAALLLRILHNLWIYPYLKNRLTDKQKRGNRATHMRTIALIVTGFSPVLYSHASDAPKVVVGIVIDQLRTDYLEKYAHLYGEDGFKKLLTQGRVYTNGFYSHANPDRSSAIASVYTGTTPYYNGITGNRFLERESLKVIASVDDTQYTGINTSAQSSPSKLMVTTLTDELKIASKGHAYIMSLAPERDAAILAGGHAPNAAIWLSDDKAMWASSSYYNGMPSWIRQYNHRNNTQFDWKNIKWEPYYPTGVYSYSVYDGIPQAFHHSFRNGDAETVKRYKTSAIINDEITQLAKTCIAGSMFGRNKTTDMLCIGYYAGNFQHMSQWEAPIELQDIYCRLDRNIADLIQTIEAKVGVGNALFFITSTGYSDSHLPDTKLFTLPTGELKMERCTALLNLYLGALYGKDNYIESSYLNEIYLNHSLIEKKQLKMKELMERCTEFLCQITGIKRVYPSLDLLSGLSDANMRESYNAGRSGDLLLEIAPGWTLVDERWGERIYYNRAHVPVPIIYYGAGITSLLDRTPTPVESIAPTIAHLLRISVPNGCSETPLN